MHRIFRKDQVLTIPNLLSVIRLALIPLIVWLYIGKQEYSAAVAVILISGATDIIDGFIARKFNMVSDLGKILDPVADKLTQATVILCLTVKYRWMRGLIVLFVVKEIIMAVLGYMAIQKKDVVNSAKWYGKLNTVVLYLVMMCLILFPSISETSVYKGYKQDKIEMRGDRAEMSDFPLYLNTVAGGLDRRDQTIGGFSFVVKIYAVPVVEIIG